ncbi:hypothetical protein BH23ACT9_BH23ACT9_30790 [soil metagenome]
MNVEPAEVSLAYTYAWWLTGSEDAARTAVLAAVDRPDVPSADGDLRIEIMLRRVRSAAITQPTMCPASELALLHDAIGLGLDAAAGLTKIDARDARTELAHGRLEALDTPAILDIPEPQRLGGLAVGNPGDVAAARQNPELARLRDLIMQGRDELVTVSRIEMPADLLDQVASRTRDGAPTVPEAQGDEDDWFADVDAAVAANDVDAAADGAPAADDADDDAVDDDDAGGADEEEDGDGVDIRFGAVDTEFDAGSEEIDLTERGPVPNAAATGSSQRRTSAVWLLVGLVVLVGVAVLLTRSGDGVVPGQVAVEPTQDVDPTSPPTTTPTGTPEPTPTAIAFDVDAAGVAVGIGSDPDFANPEAGPFDPVSFTVSYVGAQEDDALVVTWVVDGEPFGSERAELSPLLTSARFSRQVPAEGWPEGQHTLTFTLERTGEQVGEAQFTVVTGTDTVGLDAVGRRA